MPFELKHASLRSFLVPNHTQVNVKVRGEADVFEDWRYCGFDDQQLFILITRDGLARWLPISSIAYIEQTKD